jgi:hypothetical protein
MFDLGTVLVYGGERNRFSPRRRTMQITIEIPDMIAGWLAGAGRDPARALLEAFALEGYRRQDLGESAVRRLLGFETREEAHGFLKQHGAFLPYTVEDAERDTAVALEVARRYRAQRDETDLRAG